MRNEFQYKLKKKESYRFVGGGVGGRRASVHFHNLCVIVCKLICINMLQTCVMCIGHVILIRLNRVCICNVMCMNCRLHRK